MKNQTILTVEEAAIRDAKNLVRYSAKAGLDVDNQTIKTLIIAADKWESGEWSEEFAIEFWKTLGKMSQVIKPATVDGIKAISTRPKRSGFLGFVENLFGRSLARQASNTYTLLMLFVMSVLLFFQVYWLIGNNLIIQLGDLLDREAEVASEINQLNQTYSEIELRFKITEAEKTSFQGDSNFTFYLTPDWERETLYINLDRTEFESQLDAIRTQLERNLALLLQWARPWQGIIPDSEGNPEFRAQIEEYQKQLNAKELLINRDPDGREEITAKQEQLKDMETKISSLPENAGQDLELRAQLSSDKASLEQWLASPNLSNLIISQRTKELEDLKAKKASLERLLERELVKEKSRLATLGADFVLAILQSYILPILYGLLGASAFVLRTLDREIEEVTYSLESNRNYILRLALGTLAGLMVGWFIFLLPGQSFLASVSPLALAFLVGYNIEILFSLMDKLIEVFRKPVEKDAEKQNATIASEKN